MALKVLCSVKTDNYSELVKSDNNPKFPLSNGQADQGITPLRHVFLGAVVMMTNGFLLTKFCSLGIHFLY